MYFKICLSLPIVAPTFGSVQGKLIGHKIFVVFRSFFSSKTKAVASTEGELVYKTKTKPKPKPETQSKFTGLESFMALNVFLPKTLYFKKIGIKVTRDRRISALVYFNLKQRITFLPVYPLVKHSSEKLPIVNKLWNEFLRCSFFLLFR